MGRRLEELDRMNGKNLENYTEAAYGIEIIRPERKKTKEEEERMDPKMKNIEGVGHIEGLS